VTAVEDGDRTLDQGMTATACTNEDAPSDGERRRGEHELWRRPRRRRLDLTATTIDVEASHRLAWGTVENVQRRPSLRGRVSHSLPDHNLSPSGGKA
jgi:hypothetical protein